MNSAVIPTPSVTGSTLLRYQSHQASHSNSFLLDERLDIGIGLGRFVMPIDAGIKAAGVGASGEGITAPLPTIDLRVDIAPTLRWFLCQSTEAFYLEIAVFRGGLFSRRVALDFKPW